MPSNGNHACLQRVFLAAWPWLVATGSQPRMVAARLPGPGWWPLAARHTCLQGQQGVFLALAGGRQPRLYITRSPGPGWLQPGPRSGSLAVRAALGVHCTCKGGGNLAHRSRPPPAPGAPQWPPLCNAAAPPTAQPPHQLPSLSQPSHPTPVRLPPPRPVHHPRDPPTSAPEPSAALAAPTDPTQALSLRADCAACAPTAATAHCLALHRGPTHCRHCPLPCPPT